MNVKYARCSDFFPRAYGVRRFFISVAVRDFQSTNPNYLGARIMISSEFKYGPSFIKITGAGDLLDWRVLISRWCGFEGEFLKLRTVVVDG